MNKREAINRILFYLKDSENRFPYTWDNIETEHIKYKKDIPSWCYCPSTILQDTIVKKDLHHTITHFMDMDVDILTALYSWKATKSLFFFNDILTSSLQRTIIKDKIPFEILHRLPVWCPYVAFEKDILIDKIDKKFEGSDALLKGFFVLIDYTMETKKKNLLIITDINCDGQKLLTPVNFDMNEDNDILSAINKGFDNNKEKLKDFSVSSSGNLYEQREAYKILCEIGQYLLPFILYLCSEKPDMEKKKVIVKSKKRKNKSTFNSSIEPDFWDVGFNVAKQLVQYEQSDNHTGSKMHPHVRHAHWHTYYAGPRSAEEREIRIKWIPNILVNFNSDSDIKPTVYNM